MSEKVLENFKKLIQKREFHGIVLFLTVSLFLVFRFYAKASLSISLVMIPIAIGIWIIGLLVTLEIGNFFLKEKEE